MVSENSPIVLVGFMGCGKTAVARELARILDKPWLDLDARIEEEEERSPAQIIDQDGEAAFREKETRTLRQVLNTKGERVIALGGGAWTIDENRELLREHKGIAIWLDASFDLCWKRIEAQSEARPLAPSREAAERLYSERRPIYSLADFHVEVTVVETPAVVAERIAVLLRHQSHT